ncbi:MAG: DUF4136 domain-containing protein [Bryobacteraceae bacterium]
MRKYALSVALIVCAVTAHAQKVKVDWDRMTDFTRYKTYKWMKIPSPRTPTPEMQQLIYSDVDTLLEFKGLKKLENGEPDLYVGYSVTLAQPKGQTAAAPVAESSAWQTGSSWSAHSPSDKAARKGTLVVEIAEVKRNLLVWKGSVMAEVGDSVNDARVKISRGLGKAFVQYPPPAK